MKIFIMRHGEAEIMASSDQQRPLTAHGQQQSLQQAHKLQQQGIRPQRVLVSPYLRAQQTFEQVNQAFNPPLSLETWQQLTPYGDEKLVADYLAVLKQQGIDCLLIISHLPLVGSIVSELCGQNWVNFYTATIAEIQWDGTQGQLVSTTLPD